MKTSKLTAENFIKELSKHLKKEDSQYTLGGYEIRKEISYVNNYDVKLSYVNNYEEEGPLDYVQYDCTYLNGKLYEIESIKFKRNCKAKAEAFLASLK